MNKPQKFTVDCGMNATVIKISRSGFQHFGHTLVVLFNGVHKYLRYFEKLD